MVPCTGYGSIVLGLWWGGPSYWDTIHRRAIVPRNGLWFHRKWGYGFFHVLGYGPSYGAKYPCGVWFHVLGYSYNRRGDGSMYWAWFHRTGLRSIVGYVTCMGYGSIVRAMVATYWARFHRTGLQFTVRGYRFHLTGRFHRTGLCSIVWATVPIVLGVLHLWTMVHRTGLGLSYLGYCSLLLGLRFIVWAIVPIRNGLGSIVLGYGSIVLG